jgi:20S proteasome subunit alpha 7
MASSGSGYDLSAATFSPDGRIFQVEYASKAVDNASTIIGVLCSDGVVLAVSKPLVHKLVVPTTGSYKRIHHVDKHAGMASTGCLPDARQLVGRAMDECRDYKEFYGAPVPPGVLADRLGAYVHYFTLHGALRPFGAAALLAAYDDDMEQPALYMVEPNGVAYSYYGVAAGKGKQAAKTELEKLQLHKAESRISCTEAVQQATKILTMLFQEQSENEGKQLELEVSWICKDSNWEHVYVPAETVAAAKAWAKEQLEAEDDDEEQMEE